MGQGQQFLPGPTLWLFHVPYNREIPPLQGRMRGRPCRKHRETALKILSRRKPPGNVTLLATASEGPRNESFAHVLSLHSLWVHIFAIFFSFFLHYALLLVPLQGRFSRLLTHPLDYRVGGRYWTLPCQVLSSLLFGHLTHILFRLMPGRIHRCHRDSSRSQNHVLQQELAYQGEYGEACHRWSNHENGQRPGKQHQGQQTDIAHPKASNKQHTGKAFKGGEYIDERAVGQERKRHREQDNDRLRIVKMQGANPEQDQAQADAQQRPREPFGETEQCLHKISFFGLSGSSLAMSEKADDQR